MAKERREEVRLTGKDLFIFYIKGVNSKAGGCTNKRLLEERTGKDYETLMKIFTRKGQSFYEDEGIVIIKVHPVDIKKGRQSLSRKGTGGMERFRNFVIGKVREY